VRIGTSAIWAHGEVFEKKYREISGSLSQLQDALPRALRGFQGSHYLLPLCQAILGHLPEAAEVRKELEQEDGDDVGHLALHAALASECWEAVQPEAGELFVRDAQLRGLVFSGGKWRAGWAFLMGPSAGALKELSSTGSSWCSRPMALPAPSAGSR